MSWLFGICDELARKNTILILDKKQSDVLIFYSDTPRAKLSAELINSELTAIGKKVVEFKSLTWLGFLYLDLQDEQGRARTDEEIRKLLGQHLGAFAIFISHQKDIASYAQVDNSTVLNCSFFARDFHLAGHQKCTVE